MENTNGEMAKTLEQYACDYCRYKKLRCSREKPKCNNCRPWVSDCIYSRQGVLPRRVRPKLNEKTPSPPVNETRVDASLDMRLAKIEASIESLTNAVQSLASAIATKRETGASEDTQEAGGSSANPYFLDNSDSTSYLPIGSEILTTYRNDSGLNLPTSVSKRITDLAKLFTTTGLDDEVRQQLEKSRRERDDFFIPSIDEGHRLVKLFMEILDFGAPIFQAPSAETALKTVFQPWTVDRGWVLLFNYTMSTHLAHEEPSNAWLSRKLRWNIWLALDSADLFLEPSVVKVTALMLLAVHGDDIPSPTLSWTLISHACRMGVGLGLHSSARVSCNAQDREASEQEQKQFLFWSLFMLDKSLSLAFGRPPFMIGQMYDDIPFPSHKQLAKFSPHTRRTGTMRSHDTQHGAVEMGFGGAYLLQFMKLSQIQGKMLQHLPTSNRQTSSQWFHTQKFEADIWRRESREILSRAARIESGSPIENKETEVGVNHIDFQYHCLVVFLTRRRLNEQKTCMDSARNALRLLENLVSTSMQVYNGIMWQLLYYPFTHFFIVFGHILSRPDDAESKEDLSLLHGTVTFFKRMSSNHSAATKLQTVAETFTSLAEAYVKHPNTLDQLHQGGNTADAEMSAPHDSSNTFNMGGFSGTQFAETMAQQPQLQPSSLLMNLNAQAIDSFDDSLYDFSATIPQYAVGPLHAGEGVGDSNSEFNIQPNVDEMMQSLGEMARKRPFDYAFDWFNWHGGEAL